MTDARIAELTTIEGPFFDLFLRLAGDLDEREELATAVRVALGTDSLADEVDVLPDLDSSDRRGWWGDLEAETIWGGWPIGCKNWLLTRAKITDVTSVEGSTLQRAKQYTAKALQPLIDKRIATRVDVDAQRTELNRIEVRATIYRGPKAEIDLRYQLLWEEEAAVEDIAPAPIVITNKKIRVPYRDLVLSPTAPLSPIVTYKNVIVPAGNLLLSQQFPPVLNIRNAAVFTITQSNLLLSPTMPIVTTGNDAYTKLILHFGGADGSVVFTDSSLAAHITTPISDAQVDTAQSKFGGTSCLFDGANDGLMFDGSSDFVFDTGDWTVDFWVRWNGSNPSGTTGVILYDSRPVTTTGNYPTIYVRNPGNEIIFHTGGVDRIIGSALVTNTWYHIAVSRSGSNTRLFLNGVKVGATWTTDNTVYLNAVNRPVMGINGYDLSFGPLNGWIDEVRVSKGIARWTANFTPPTTAY